MIVSGGTDFCSFTNGANTCAAGIACASSGAS